MMLIKTRPQLMKLGKMRRVKSGACFEVGYIKNMTREGWLEMRRDGIGGSDVAGVLGLSKWDSPLSIWMDKTGRLRKDVQNDFTKWGTRLEGLIRNDVAELMADRDGSVMEVFEAPHTYCSTAASWMRYSPDGIVHDHDIDEIGLLEIKTASEFVRSQWGEDEVPDAYYAQVQHGMAVMGLEWCLLVVLVGKEYLHRIVPRNEQFIEMMVDRSKAFWDMVIADVMPAPIGSDADDEALVLLGSPSNEDTVEDPTLEDHLAAYAEIQSELKTLEVRKKEIQQLVKSRLGTAKTLLAGAHKATWSRFTTTKLDTDRLKKEQGGIIAQYSNVVESSRLLIK